MSKRINAWRQALRVARLQSRGNQIGPFREGQEKTMKTAIKVLAIMAALSMTCAVMADATGKSGGIKGKVESVDTTSMAITVKNKQGEVTITTDAKTAFTIDGKSASEDGTPYTIKDVKEGERVVSVTPADGTATEVKLMSAKKKKKNQEPTTAPAAN
jgi:hypothetical protein